jgi:aspartate aminotransferase-like enzyme
MFGPNYTRKVSINLDYHHRSNKFRYFYQACLENFKEKFRIGDDYAVLFITGSGTLAVESFIASFNGKLRMNTENLEQEKFNNRWLSIINHYGKYDKLNGELLYTQFETSANQYYSYVDAAIFTDAISSFPYFEKPQTPAWATVSSKILGGLPIISIVVIKKDLLESRIELSPSYLNLLSYYEYKKKQQTPTTTAIPVFEDFSRCLADFDVNKCRAQIDDNFEKISKAVGVEQLVSVDKSPVLAVKPGVISEELIEKWGLYVNSVNNSPQIFLYSENEESYDALEKDLKRTS